MLSAFRKTHRIFALAASLLAYIVLVKEKPSSMETAMNIKRTQAKQKSKNRKARILKKDELALYQIQPAGINNNIPTLKYEELDQESSSRNDRGSGSNPEKSNSQSKQLSYIDKSICHQENKDLSGHFEDYARQGQNVPDVLQLVIPEENSENSNNTLDIDIKAMLDEFKKPNPIESAFKLKDINGKNKGGALSIDSMLEESKNKLSQKSNPQLFNNTPDNDALESNPQISRDDFRKPARKYFKVKRRKKKNRSGRKGGRAGQFNKKMNSSDLKL